MKKDPEERFKKILEEHRKGYHVLEFENVFEHLGNKSIILFRYSLRMSPIVIEILESLDYASRPIRDANPLITSKNKKYYIEFCDNYLPYFFRIKKNFRSIKSAKKYAQTWYLYWLAGLSYEEVSIS